MIINQIILFQISKFSVRGRVVDKEGNGLKDIKITLDGEKKAVSDVNGYYLLEKVFKFTLTLFDPTRFPLENTHLKATMSISSVT